MTILIASLRGPLSHRTQPALDYWSSWAEQNYGWWSESYPSWWGN